MKFRPIFKSNKSKSVALCCKVCCSSLQYRAILRGYSAAVVVLWCGDSRIIRWGNPEHSVSLSDTPVSTHDKQHTHTHTSVCQAQPSSRFLPHPLLAKRKYISCLFFFCLGKMASTGGKCVNVCAYVRACMRADCTEKLRKNTPFVAFVFRYPCGIGPSQGKRAAHANESPVIQV